MTTPAFGPALEHVLEDGGFVVIGEAQDGASGLAAATAMRPAVVLLDVQLPDVDGFDVAAWLTGQDDGPAVVLTSSRDGSEFGVRIVLGEDSALLREGSRSQPSSDTPWSIVLKEELMTASKRLPDSLGSGMTRRRLLGSCVRARTRCVRRISGCGCVAELVGGRS